jgi:hypothetical protein
MNDALQVTIWPEPPSMDTGAPHPQLKIQGHVLWPRYVCRNPEFSARVRGASLDHPSFDIYCALIRFDGVVCHKFGAPNDESLHAHPLYSRGLQFYEFHEIFGSSDLREQKEKRHWIITFHDETFEVIAEKASVVSRRIEGENTSAILLSAN